MPAGQDLIGWPRRGRSQQLDFEDHRPDRRSSLCLKLRRFADCPRRYVRPALYHYAEGIVASHRPRIPFSLCSNVTLLARHLRCTDLLSLSNARMLRTQQQPRPLPVYSRSHSGKVEISRLLKPKDEETAPSLAVVQPTARSASVPPTVIAPATTDAPPLAAAAAGTVPTKRLSGTHPGESPAKKQSKWSPEEDAKIIQLRGDGMKWEDISKHLPGRSAISCRLHYQNYLERRSEWDEDRKNKLARLYERYVEQGGTRSCHTRSC
jgi:hypothetical protein